MKILGIDTSNQVMTVALMEESRLLVERTVNVKRNHSIQLMPAVEDCCKEAGWEPADLDRVVVARGPGSYTGVRIGVTVAKTLAFSLGIDLTGVSSLKVLAANAERIPDSYIVPLFDARRGNIYTGLYHYKDNTLVQVEKDTHISAKQWAEYISKFNAPIQLVGADTAQHLAVFKEACQKQLVELPADRHYPRASVLAGLGKNLEPENVHLFEPEYIKLAEAEQKWVEAHPEQNRGGGWIEKL